jgi:hypothetical protein
MAVETQEVLEEVSSGKVQPWWCLDTYLVAHLAELLTKLRDEGVSFSPRFNTSDAWQNYLTEMIKRLEAYDTDDAVAYANAQLALHEFVTHLSDFWD